MFRSNSKELRQSHIVFSVNDEKIGTFGPPVLARNAEEAKRMLAQMAPKSPVIMSSPSDFRAYQVGAWDDETGSFEAVKPPVLICTLDAVLPKPDLDPASPLA